MLKIFTRFRSLYQPQIGIVVCAILVVLILALYGNFYVGIPLLFATIIYAMQLAFVRAIFVNKLHNHWEMMIEFIKIKNQDSADISLSYRFFGLACWGASIFIYLFSLLVLIAISIYISFDKSSYLIASMFGFLAIMAAVLSWSRKATSMPDMEKIKRIVFSKSLDRLISRFDRVGIAGAILSLVIALHALGSFFFCDLDRLSFELNDACCIKPNFNSSGWIWGRSARASR